MQSSATDHCWAEIDRAALRHNAAVVRDKVGAQTQVLAVVKADAYGHGIVEVARTLQKDAELFGVANFQEARRLREAGLSHPILILGPALPAERAQIIAGGVIPSVSSLAEAHAFAGHSLGVNFAIDTGMGRMGCWKDDAVAELEQLGLDRGVKLHSISTHLPVADEDADSTRDQLLEFEQLVREIRHRVPGDYKVHVLLSAGILGFPQYRFDMIRAGLMLYGSSPFPAAQPLLRPVMTLKSRICLVREVPPGRTISYGRTFTTTRTMRVATIAVGYADGYRRALSNSGAAVLIGGRRCPVLGRVTMDLTMADVSAVPEVRPGDEVVLFGRQGGQEIFAAEVAERAGTIAWEIFTGIGSRVRRVYL